MYSLGKMNCFCVLNKFSWKKNLFDALKKTLDRHVNKNKQCIGRRWYQNHDSY